MTAPRQYLRGATYLLTRRCFQRHFFLRPSKRTNEAFRFVLAVAAGRYGIRLHAYCVLSNHCYGVTCQHA
jgi:REP element-mobilizing transposase RayT